MADIRETSDRYADYIKGWDDALRRAAFDLDGEARDKVLALVKQSRPERRFPAPVEASVYFFCTEALTNVVRHARATSASVRVDVTAEACTVEVRDDGIGGARPRSQVSGLVGLRDRIGALQGTVEVISPDGGGTLLRASIPLPPGPPDGPGVALYP